MKAIKLIFKTPTPFKNNPNKITKSVLKIQTTHKYNSMQISNVCGPTSVRDVHTAWEQMGSLTAQSPR